MRADDGSGRFVACPLTYAHRNFAVGVFVSLVSRSFPMIVTKFRGNDGRMYLLTNTASMPVPVFNEENADHVASALIVQEIADEIARLDSEPQPAARALPVFVR